MLEVVVAVVPTILIGQYHVVVIPPLQEPTLQQPLTQQLLGNQHIIAAIHAPLTSRDITNL